MKYFRIPNCVEKSAVQLLVIALIALNLGLNPAIAGETKGQLEGAGPKALSPVDASDFVLSAHPAVGKINQTRTIFLRFQPPGGCIRTYAFSLDTSLAESQRLILVRTQVKEGLCGVIPRPNPVRAEFEFAHTMTGPLRIRDENSGAEITIQTVPASPPSKFDVNGMWFDAATNGSGIALHHRRSTTDIAFGTWFLYNNNGESRWVSFQSTNWQQDGSVLEGLLIETRGGCQFPSLVACPASGTFRTDPPQDLFSVAPSLARITFQSATRARAEVLTLSGAVLFASELTKLQF